MKEIKKISSIIFWVSLVSMLYIALYSGVQLFGNHVTTFTCPSWVILTVSLCGFITSTFAANRISREKPWRIREFEVLMIVMFWISWVAMIAGALYSGVQLFGNHVATFACPSWMAFTISICGFVASVFAADRMAFEQPWSSVTN